MGLTHRSPAPSTGHSCQAASIHEPVTRPGSEAEGELQRCSGQDGAPDRQLPPEDPLGTLCTRRVGLTNRWPGVEGTVQEEFLIPTPGPAGLAWEEAVLISLAQLP